MKLRPVDLEGRLGLPFFNFAVDNGRVEDYLAVYRWVRQQGVRPRLLVIGLDLEALHNADVPDPRLLACRPMWSQIRRELAPHLDWRQRGRRAWGAQARTLNPQYGADLMRSVRLALGPGKGMPARMSFERDGYLRSPLVEEQRAAGRFDLEAAIAQSTEEYTVRFADMTGLSAWRRAMLEELITEAQGDGADARVWLTAIHPRTAEQLAQRTSYGRLLVSAREYLETVGRQCRVPTFDFSEPGRFGGNLEDWYDGGHIDARNAELVVAKLAGAPQQPGSR
jgi:hypothetical protein